MRILRPLALAAGLAVPLVIGACSTKSSSSDDGGGDLYIVSCSLGCSNGQGGEQVFCAIVNTYQNQELSIIFSEPIDLFSVNSSSFRVVNVANGTSPSGQFFRDPLNPRRLIFRPSLAFDANGNPIFGFEDNTAYQITIPGTEQGDAPPFIHSTAGKENRSRMQCTILTSEGIIDPVPGAPSVRMFVDVVTGYDLNGDPNSWAFDVEVTKSPELVDVWRDTGIDFEFDDIMNVATLLNPSTGEAPFITIEIDDDGTLATLEDRVAVEGNFTFAVDQEQLVTYLYFTGALPFPSAGPDAPLSPRRIAVTIPSSVQDLVSNPVLPENGGGTSGMVPELSQFTEITLPQAGGEDFQFGAGVPGSNEDGDRGGAFWGGGRLTSGIGGGAGRLGDLVVPNGVVVTLSTDSQTFPLTPDDGTIVFNTADILGNPDPATFPDTLGNFPDSITITDGGWEFTKLWVEPGGSLRLEGENAARLWSRGEALVEFSGEIDLVGATPDPIDSMKNESGGPMNPSLDIPLKVNAANGADGGYGADRFDMTDNGPLLGSGETDDNNAVLNPGGDPDGRSGKGVGRVGNKGGGPGGTKFPRLYPTVNTSTEPPLNNNHEVGFNVTVSGDFNVNDTQCRSLMVGGTGGGGAYATDGQPGHAESTQPTAGWPVDASNAPPDTPGGSSAEIGLAPPDENNDGYILRKLEWPLDNLRGGSGGGGGGNHPFGARANGYDGTSTQDCIGPNSFFRSWHDHAGAQGGYGGGAFHFVSGKKLSIQGLIDLRGGDGGTPRGETTPDPPFFFDWGQFAMPGGGGSGGAIRMQSMVVDLADGGVRIDIAGGAGGFGFAGATQGGYGGNGLVRIEDAGGTITRAELAPSINPYDPIDDSLSWISVAPGAWSLTPRQRPDSMSASSSCWLFPDGNFFALGFTEDEEDVDTGDPTKMGWNMNVFWQPDSGFPEEKVPFRGANSIFFNAFETEFGKLLGHDLGVGESAAPMAVRFQGARIGGSFDGLDYDRCTLDLNEINTILVPGSVTPWVDHPVLLNDFNPKPNMVRFCVIFDGTVDVANNDTPGLVLAAIKGVTELGIRATPD